MKVVKLRKLGVVAWVEEGAILTAPLDTFEQLEADTVEVTAPHSQAFLNIVNRSFGTKFRLSEFSGR